MSKVDEHFVNLYRTAGEILWHLTVKTACQIELSAVSQAFKFRFCQRAAHGERLTWQYCLSYVEIDRANYPCSAWQWASFIAVKWNEAVCEVER
jgi:hypothetical protein